MKLNGLLYELVLKQPLTSLVVIRCTIFYFNYLFFCCHHSTSSIRYRHQLISSAHHLAISSSSISFIINSSNPSGWASSNRSNSIYVPRCVSVLISHIYIYIWIKYFIIREEQQQPLKLKSYLNAILFNNNNGVILNC